MVKHRFYIIVVALLAFACKPTQPIVDGGKKLNVDGKDGEQPIVKKEGVDEDISTFRITYETDNTYEEFDTPKIIKKIDKNPQPKQVKTITSKDHVNASIEKKLAQIRYLNSDVNKVMVHRILIYSGNNVNTARSLHADLKVALSGTGQFTAFDYEPPNYIVKTGKYISKLKAHEMYTTLKEDFPSAVLIKEKVNFNRSNYIID